MNNTKKLCALLALLYTGLIIPMEVPAQEDLNTQLLEASQEYDIEAQCNSLMRCSNLIDQGAQINCSDQEGFTPLITAAINNNLILCQFYYETGASINAQTKDGETALFFASIHPNKELYNFLLKKGAKEDLSKRKQLTSQRLISETRCPNFSIEEVQELIKAGANVNTRDSNDGATPLLIAAENDNFPIAQLLIQNNAEVNIQCNRDGYSPLLFATAYKNQELINLLIANNADTSTLDPKKITNLQLLLTVQKEDHSVDEIKELLKKGAHIETQCYCCDRTPLFYVAENDNFETCKYLLENGANVSAQDDASKTALSIAAEEQNHEICNLLLPYYYFLPAVETLKESEKIVIATMCSLNKKGIPAELHLSYILRKNKKLNKHFINTLILKVVRGKSIPEEYLFEVASALTDFTLIKLKQIVKTAIDEVNDMYESCSDELASVLDPETLETNFGNKIQNNIIAKLLAHNSNCAG